MSKPTFYNKSLCFFVCGIAGSVPLIANPITWVAVSPNSDMNNPANWSPSIIPTSADDAIFDSSITNVDTTPIEQSADFSVSTFQFPTHASPFTIAFKNRTLTFNGIGITGSHTNTTINSTFTNSISLIDAQVLFINGINSSCGSATFNIDNSASQTGNVSSHSVGVLAKQLTSISPFAMQNGATLNIANVGVDSTTGTGGNSSGYVIISQASFDESVTSGNNCTISISNSGTFNGSNSSIANHVGYVGQNQFKSHDDFHAGDNLNFTVSNSGTNNGTGVSGNFVGAVIGPQAYFNAHCSLGDHGTITLSNKGSYSGNCAPGDYTGYILDHQLYVNEAFAAGDSFALTTTNTGSNDSNGNGGRVIANIDSSSGSTGYQVFFNDTFTIGDNAAFTVQNSGKNTGNNTTNGNIIGTMNQGQAKFSGAFVAGDSLIFDVSNSGEDSSQGIGSNSTGNVSSIQLEFSSSCIVGNNASLSVHNDGSFIGSNSTTFCYSGDTGEQMKCNGNFQSGDSFHFVVENNGSHSGSGVGYDFIGMLTSGTQAQFLGSCTLGDNASIDIKNSGTNFSNCSSPVQVGSLFSNGQQMYVADQFQAGNNLKICVSNTGNDNSAGVGGSYVGSINLSGPVHPSQVRFGSGCSVGDNASISAINSGTYTGSNTATGNIVGHLSGTQIYVESAFHAGKHCELNASNTGLDSSQGQGSNAIGTNDNSQIYFNNTCTVGPNAKIQMTNSGTYSGNSAANSNYVGFIQSHQFYDADKFTAGDSLNLSIENMGVANNTGIGGNYVGVIFDHSQLQLDNGCSLGNDATISVSNSGKNGSGTGTLNNIGFVGASQVQVTGAFVAGKNLKLIMTNSADNAGDISNNVGYIGNCQALFQDTCTVGNGSLISASNSGIITGSQILLRQGFNIASGKGKFQAINHGDVGINGISIQGDSLGGNANIVLENSSLNIDTAFSTFTIGELNGDSTSFVQSNPTLIINTDSTTHGDFSGDIQDFPFSISSLIKTGPGKQTLSGINTYTGLTTVEEGTLVVRGSLTGDVDIKPLGILKGSGTIGGSLTNTGTVSPGESIGTITILGNFTNDNANYDLEVNGAGQSDLIDVKGTATLNGGSVILSSVDGLYKFQQPYTILTAANRSGTFSGVNASPLIHPTLSYDANHVYLTLQTAIELAAKTSNQRAVAKRLDNIANPNANQTLLLSELVDLPVPAARKALTSLSGYQHTDDLLITELLDRQFIRRLYDPIRTLVTTEPNYCDNPCTCEWSKWVETGSGYSRWQSNENTHNFNINSYEITAGLQKTFCHDLTGGIAGSYEYDNLHYHDGGKGKSNSYLLGLYGLYRPSCFYGFADIGYGYSINTLERLIRVGSLHYTARSKPKISQFFFYGEVGADINVSCLLIQPFAGIESGKSWRSHVTESKTHGWGLSIHKRDWSVTNSRLGLHLTTNDRANNLDISLDVAWNRLLSSSKNTIDGGFIEFGNSFDIKGINLSKDGVDYALTVSTSPNSAFTAYLELAGETWDHANTFNVLGGIEYSW